jgi:hypothetical protein
MSSSFGLTFTRNDLIKAVLRTLGVIGQTQSPSPEDYTFCSEALNLMIKAMMSKGAVLWKIQEIAVPMISGIPLYPIGPSAGYLATAGITITAGGTGANGTYALGIADAGGGTGATGTYTVSGGTISAVTITAPGSGYVSPVLSFPSGGVAGQAVTIIPVGLTTPRVQRVLDQGNFIRNNLTQYDQSTQMISRTDYNNLGAKLTNGTIPCQQWYDPAFTTTNDNGYLRVSPVPGPLITHTMHLMCQIIINDTLLAGDLFDFPVEWLNVLKFGLAYELIPEYGCDQTTEERVEKRFKQYEQDAYAASVEESSTYFGMDTRGGGGGGYGGGGSW